MIEVKIKRLELAHTWTISRNSSDFKDNGFVRIRKDGIEGIGEAAPNVRYGENAQLTTQKIEEVREFFSEYDLYHYMDLKIAFDEKIIDQAIDMVYVRHLIHKKIYALSDGQLQMVMIARAQAQDTPIILLDEPTAHLDLNNRVEMMRLLRNLTRSTNKAILLATHDLDLAHFLTSENAEIAENYFPANCYAKNP